jgi:hypothetical protein
MSIKRAAIYARNIFVVLLSLSIVAFLVKQATARPDTPFNRAVLGAAYIPQFVYDTWNNLNVDPYDLARVPDEFGGKFQYRPVANHTGHRIEGVVMRAGDSAGGPLPGWRLLHGTFQIDGEPGFAVLALSPHLAIEHAWLIDSGVLSESSATVGSAQFPHGLAFLRDGSIVAGFDDAYRTVRLGACGKRLWTSDARLNHAIYAVDNDRFLWGVGADNRLQKVDAGSGRIVQTISPDHLRRANPHLTVLDMRRLDDNRLGENARRDTDAFLADPYHINDVEPLTPAMAENFPQFRAGDLLVSFRSLNLVAVIDPHTHKIKWLTNRYTLRQHDPDWEPDGTISVFDNQMGREFSRIVSFDPRSDEHRTIADGNALNFYSRIRGKHQSLANGGLLISSAEQGRVVELGPDGKIALEILVQDPDTPGKNFVFSEAMHFPPDAPQFRKVTSCTR